VAVGALLGPQGPEAQRAAMVDLAAAQPLTAALDLATRHQRLLPKAITEAPARPANGMAAAAVVALERLEATLQRPRSRPLVTVARGRRIASRGHP